MDAKTPAVQNLLIVLTTKIADSKTKLEAQAIGNAIYGLQSMDATTPAVQNILIALTIKIIASIDINEWFSQRAAQTLSYLQDQMINQKPLFSPLPPQERAPLATFASRLGKKDKSKHCLNELASHNSSMFFSKKPAMMQDGHDDWPWFQCLSGCFQLAKNSVADEGAASRPLALAQWILNLINDHKLKVSPPDADLKRQFIEILQKQCLQKNILDLHGLDHLSAKILLESLNTADQLPESIIVGRGSHSKHSEIKRMQGLVFDYLSKINLQEKPLWANDEGSVRFKRIQPFSPSALASAG